MSDCRLNTYQKLHERPGDFHCIRTARAQRREWEARCRLLLTFRRGDSKLLDACARRRLSVELTLRSSPRIEKSRPTKPTLRSITSVRSCQGSASSFCTRTNIAHRQLVHDRAAGFTNSRARVENRPTKDGHQNPWVRSSSRGIRLVTLLSSA
jgi:hypothetical protein